MAELYFKYKQTPYLFDTEQIKLFRLKDGRRIEIDNLDTIQKVRLRSIEINRELALRLAFEHEIGSLAVDDGGKKSSPPHSAGKSPIPNHGSI